MDTIDGYEHNYNSNQWFRGTNYLPILRTLNIVPLELKREEKKLVAYSDNKGSDLFPTTISKITGNITFNDRR